MIIKDLVRTSGDSSDRITAPLVSTWMTFADGRAGVTEAGAPGVAVEGDSVTAGIARNSGIMISLSLVRGL